ncbi:acyltransferase [uncultured Clostridium sp.]|uniref:acyltransferase family protein n=1 Tax=uncultured Clostridium sp. TaxID=59620 RepID=UPI0025E6A696|nr:acyltransferase [uncultured Clostridium sp.]
MEKKEHIYTYDFIKLMMAVIIALLHYNYKLVPQGYLCVEGFFLLGGFFLISNQQLEYESFSKLIYNKFKKLYPMYLGTIILSLIFCRDAFTLDSFFKNLIYMQAIGFLDTVIPTMVPLWYMSVYIWCSILFLGLFKNWEKGKANFICLIICFGSFLCLYTFNPGHAFNYSLEKFIILPVGFIRGMANMSLGILLFSIYQKIKTINFNGIRRVSEFVVFLQIIITILIIKIICFSGITAEYDFTFVILCSLLVILIQINSKIFNKQHIFNKLKFNFRYLSELSYPIYLYHYFVIFLMKGNYSQYVLNSTIFYLFIVIVVAIIILEINKIIKKLLLGVIFHEKEC